MGKKILLSAFMLLAQEIWAFSLSTIQHVEIKKGNIFISGTLAPGYEFTALSPSQHKIALDSSIGAGYFLYDKIAVGASLPMRITFAPGRKGQIGLSLFASYFFTYNGLIIPYAGVDLTPSYSINELAFKLGFGINAGALISLTSNIALDFGLSPEIYIPLNSRQKLRIDVPIGFAGLRAFF